MTAVVLSGRELATRIRAEAKERATALVAAGVTPRLAVVTATDDEGSAWYVSSIRKAAEKIGIACEVMDLGPNAAAEKIRGQLAELSGDDRVHGIILQTPLPPGVPLHDLAEVIAPDKDVDGVNPISLGRIVAGAPAFAPATAEAVTLLIDHHGIALEGAEAVVVGRSVVVGKPLAHLLLGRDATVTVCHSRTRNLTEVTRRATVLVAAVGKAHLITGDHVAAGAMVLDVGTNPTGDGGLVGDVHPEVAERAGGLTPVPGGVGPVTTAVLLRRVVSAADSD